jgi:hypothetical protein
VEEPRVVELEACRVVKLRYEGAPPPDPAFFAPWDRFNEWAAEHDVKSNRDGVWAIGYAPPGRMASERIEYDACIPMDEAFAPAGLEGLDLGVTPGGRYVLCAGDIMEMPLLLRAAKRYAMAQGLAIERGWIELYLPHAEDSEEHPVGAGYRIHD